MGRRVAVKLILILDDGATDTPTSVGHCLLACCQVLFPQSILARGHVARIAFGGAREDRNEGDGWVSLAGVVGSNVIPGQMGEVLGLALDEMGADPRWQGLERMAAEWLAGKRR